MLRALALSLCWAPAFGAGSVDGSIDSATFEIRSDLMTVGRLEMRARALYGGNAAPPPRSVIEQALSVFYGYKDVTILDSKLAWASHWSLSPGITQNFSTEFSATGSADGLSLVGLEHALQTYLDAANAGILVEAASVNSLRWVEVGLTSPGDMDGTSSRHGRSASHRSLTASVASAAGVALAFAAACFASALCKCNHQQGDEETGGAPESGAPAATHADRAAPLARKCVQEPGKPSRAKDRCISYASTAATEGDDLQTMAKFTRTSSSLGSWSTGRGSDDGGYLQCDEGDEDEESSQASVESPGSPPRRPHERDGAYPAWGRFGPSDAELSPRYLPRAEAPL